jgi:O-antigen ligase
VVLAVLIDVVHEPRPGRLALGAAVSIAVVVAGAAILAPEQVDRLTTPGSSGRTNIYEVGRVACVEHCLIGSGLATFPIVHGDAFLQTPGAVGFRIDEPPHNIVLGAAVETGIAGLATMVVALALTLRSLPREVRGAPPGGRGRSPGDEHVPR